jgi:predicted O-methyltransferase YrrM
MPKSNAGQPINHMSPARALAKLTRKAGNALVRFADRVAPQPPSNRFLSFFHPGHYYSPLPDANFVEKNAHRLFADQVQFLPGIDDNWTGQEQLIHACIKYSSDYQPAGTAEGARTAKARYFTDNPFFSHLDAFAYYGILRHYRPKRILEVGSGFSSALALDVSEKFLSPRPRLDFVEPFPDRLRQLLQPGDLENITLHEKPVQDMALDIFSTLNASDVIFIDSSHVSKIGSDVNFLFLDVFPRLAPGVIIHVHDVFWPFEYPKTWLDEGRSWNEAYLLRGMLASSRRYQILLFNSQIAKLKPGLLKDLPPWARPGCAQSIWLEVK